MPLILDNYGIRKLTPRECLLFQGFPKNYKIPEGMADSKIYKQAGNAVSVPVIERIAKKIVKTLNANPQETDTLFEGSKKCDFKYIIKTWKKLNNNLKLNKVDNSVI